MTHNTAIDLFGNTEKDILHEYFVYWRERGFPHYSKGDYRKYEELKTLINFDENTIFKNKVLKQTMHSCGFLWTYFPEWIDVRYKNDKTIRQLWEDDAKLKTLIKKTYDYGKKHNEDYITVNRLRQNSKVYLSGQSVSNFRPSVAKFIYNKFGNNGVTWDMSCGFGGRLFGFMASDCKKYIGTEPNTSTFKGLKELKGDFNIRKDIELINLGSEDYIPIENSLDLCFTSPPYFDTEKYSDEPTQSYIKFPTKRLWLHGFLKKTFENCYNGLKQNGLMIINISDIKGFDTLENETVKLATHMGFTLNDTLKLELSSINGDGAKYEPIFLFLKQ